MSADPPMTVGLALIVAGLAATTYGLYPRLATRAAAGRPPMGEGSVTRV